MTMAQVAEEIDVHETTVSRGLPTNIENATWSISIQILYSRYSGKDGGTVSNTSVKEIIVSIVEQEDSKSL